MNPAAKGAWIMMGLRCRVAVAEIGRKEREKCRSHRWALSVNGANFTWHYGRRTEMSPQNVASWESWQNDSYSTCIWQLPPLTSHYTVELTATAAHKGIESTGPGARLLLLGRGRVSAPKSGRPDERNDVKKPQNDTTDLPWNRRSVIYCHIYLTKWRHSTMGAQGGANEGGSRPKNPYHPP